MPGTAVLLFFLAIPLLWIIRVSFYQNVIGGYMKAAWVAENYWKFLGDPWYLQHVLFYSFKVAVITTFLAILFAYPISLYTARSRGRTKQLLITIALAPLLINMICLIFGWIVIFRGQGLLNQFTQWVGITSEPIKYMYSEKGVIICMIYVSIPYIVLTLLDSLGRIEPSLEEAALNLGANRWQTFLKVTFPLSVPGMVAGSLIVFALNVCAFAVPMLVGSDRTPMAGLVAYAQALELNNMPFAAVISVILLVVSMGTLLIYLKLVNRFFFRRLGV
jgi:putative spermidine/putrescine transport system permease protein